MELCFEVGEPIVKGAYIAGGFANDGLPAI